MQRRSLALAVFAMAGVLVGGWGCAPRYYAAPGGPYVAPAPGGAPPVAIRYENPMLVPAADPTYVWETLVDVIDDYFKIMSEEPVRLYGNVLTEGLLETYPQIGATLLEPWHKDSADMYERLESTLQSIRRRAVVRVTPAGNGYYIEVAVFKELEDCAQPSMATAGIATFGYDDTLSRVVNPIGEAETSRGWIAQGRDAALEQRILEQLSLRLGRVPIAPPSAVAPAGGLPGSAAPGGSTLGADCGGAPVACGGEPVPSPAAGGMPTPAAGQWTPSGTTPLGSSTPGSLPPGSSTPATSSGSVGAAPAAPVAPAGVPPPFVSY